MSALILRELSENDEEAFLKSYNDWQGEDLTWHSFLYKPGMSHATHLQLLQNAKDSNKIAVDRVPGTMLYGFVNGEIVGRVSVRHSLNDFLKNRGGHIGYAVAPLYRRKGYASEMMRQALEYCNNLGLKKVLVTCDDKNMASWKIIEKFYGALENRIYDEEYDVFYRRYWIDIDTTLAHRMVISEKVVVIRRAVTIDAKAIHEAHMRSIREVCANDHSPEEIAAWGNRPFNELRRHAIIQNEYVLVLEVAGVIQGFSCLRVYEEENIVFAIIAGLYITKEVIGKGHGKEMMQLMIEEAKSKGVAKISLESTFTAHAFYQKMGFCDTGPEITVTINNQPIRCIPMCMDLEMVRRAP